MKKKYFFVSVPTKAIYFQIEWTFIYIFLNLKDYNRPKCLRIFSFLATNISNQTYNYNLIKLVAEMEPNKVSSNLTALFPLYYYPLATLPNSTSSCLLWPLNISLNIKFQFLFVVFSNLFWNKSISLSPICYRYL